MCSPISGVPWDVVQPSSRISHGVTALLASIACFAGIDPIFTIGAGCFRLMTLGRIVA
jgi:hypothetical protein